MTIINLQSRKGTDADKLEATLNAGETVLIKAVRRCLFQDVTAKVQDGQVVSIEVKEKIKIEYKK